MVARPRIYSIFIQLSYQISQQAPKAGQPITIDRDPVRSKIFDEGREPLGETLIIGIHKGGVSDAGFRLTIQPLQHQFSYGALLFPPEHEAWTFYGIAPVQFVSSERAADMFQQICHYFRNFATSKAHESEIRT